MKATNEIGKKYGRLTVISVSDDYRMPSGRTEQGVLCRCDCGVEKRFRVSSLRSGNSKSCGCLRSELSRERRLKHGLSHSRIRGIWRMMIERCEKKYNKSYKNYGGIGICVCPEWHDFEVFVEWSMKNGYDAHLTIDRIDNTKDYCPSNCRWSDRKTQNNNTSRNHLISFNGETKTMTQWAEYTGISYSALKSRINKHGWSIEKALTTPVNIR